MPDDNDQNIAQLRRLADEAQAAKDENLLLRRGLAFRDAGFSMSDPMVKFAMDNYEGEPTAEAVSTFLTGLGITNAPPPAAAPPANAESPALNPGFSQLRQELANGDPSGPPPERIRTDPYDAVFERRKYAVRNGEDLTEVGAQCVESILGAAAMGDKRVLVSPARSGMEQSQLQVPRL